MKKSVVCSKCHKKIQNFNFYGTAQYCYCIKCFNKKAKKIGDITLLTDIYKKGR